MGRWGVFLFFFERWRIGERRLARKKARNNLWTYLWVWFFGNVLWMTAKTNTPPLSNATSILGESIGIRP